MDDTQKMGYVILQHQKRDYHLVEISSISKLLKVKAGMGAAAN